MLTSLRDLRAACLRRESPVGEGGGEICAPPRTGKPHRVAGARADISSFRAHPLALSIRHLVSSYLPPRPSIIVRVPAAYDQRDCQRGGSHEEALVRVAGLLAPRSAAAGGTNARVAVAAMREGLGPVVVDLLPVVRLIQVAVVVGAGDRLHLVLLADRQRHAAIARLLAVLGRAQELLASVVAVPVGSLVVPVGVAAM